MQTGAQMVFQNLGQCSDADQFRNEIKLAVELDAMGYDFVGFVEHHFRDYAMCPDNAQALSYVAARTKRIKLMPAAFILPWNDPLRVAERTIMLDILSEGRVILGLGRGLARVEFEGFNLDMGESRDRFDQAAEIILKGLASGYVEADTPFYKQNRVELRPRWEADFTDRTYMVGMSPASVETAARLGLGVLKFSQGSWDVGMKDVKRYYELFEEYQGRPAPRIIASDVLSCAETEQAAHEQAEKYMIAYYDCTMRHYEFAGDHFRTMPAYSSYAEQAEMLQKVKLDDTLKQYLNSNLIGSPKRILDLLDERRSLIGDFDISINLSHGGMPYETAWRQAKLFAEKVMPNLPR